MKTEEQMPAQVDIIQGLIWAVYPRPNKLCACGATQHLLTLKATQRQRRLFQTVNIWVIYLIKAIADVKFGITPITTQCGAHCQKGNWILCLS